MVVPGVMGSSLVDRDGNEVWGLGKGGVLGALRTLGGSIRDLRLPADFDQGAAPDGVRPLGLIPGLHAIPGIWSPIAGYAGLERFLRKPYFGLTASSADPAAPAGNLVLFPYDWRLSNRWTASLLKARVEDALQRWRRSAPERAEAKILFVCHSMGGLVARWYVERLGGAEVTRGLLTFGTPHRGALKSLVQLSNGVRKGIGPFGIDLTAFARSLPSAYELLPAYACIDVDGDLRKTTEVSLPHLSEDRVKAGMAFHDELDSSSAEYSLMPMVGIGQPTATTAVVAGDALAPSETIGGRDMAGDGTVPRLAAIPTGLSELDPSIRGIADGHGALAGNRSALDQLDYFLTAEETVYRDAETAKGPIGLSVADLHAAGEPVKVGVHAPERRQLLATAVDETGRVAAREPVRLGKERDALERSLGTASFPQLRPGAYEIVVGAPDDPSGQVVAPVRATTLVWDQRANA